MATSPYQTLGDIRNAVLYDSREATSGNIVTQVVRWVNEGYEQVVLRKKRDWLDSQVIFQWASCTQGLCTVTNNSTVVTFGSSITLQTSLINNGSGLFAFYNPGFNEFYYVSSATTNTITLTNQYLGTTNTATTGVIVQYGFAMSNSYKELYSVYHQWFRSPCVNVGPQEYRRIMTSYGPYQDYAKYYTIDGRTSDSGKYLYVYPYPNTGYTMYADINSYLTPLSATTDEPVIPPQWRQILYHYAMYKVFSFRRNDAKAAEHLGNFNGMLAAIDGETKPELDFPQIQVAYPRGPRKFWWWGFDPNTRDPESM